MIVPLSTIVLSLFVIRSFADLNVGFSFYGNDFIEPSYILNKNWNTTTIVAQESIIQWADWLAAQGPWSVTTSTSILAPSNDTHDYISWAPYYWPNCTSIPNASGLTPQQVWVTCPYHQMDGQTNPDTRPVNNTGAFSALADAVFYNTLAWAINGSSKYPTNVASWINTWFLASDTYMNPNLNYAQIVRGTGPGSNNGTGSHMGVLDLKSMTKIVSSVLVLRAGNAPGWTSAIDAGLVNWTTQYIGWLTTSPIALNESITPSNHGSYYYNQLAALQILVNDAASANATVQKYFSTLYLNQINATGEQPFEMNRTRPYHFRTFNLAAMITNARIGSYLGFDAWNLPTTYGATIQTALDFTMALPPGTEDGTELYPDVGAVAAVYGDPNGTYVGYLSKGQQTYPANPWFFYTQPLSDSGWVRANAGRPGAATPSGTGPAGSTASAAIGKNGAGSRISLGTYGQLFFGTTTLVLLHVLLV
ncbi:chondroitin AC/alginate lyase [Russula earlei]|uniref:Chondroitin AC/alginate lyase n=1 Tax=Russula earlei TaxID=71964 RepID=A0ACC0U644_9AGAM|nr:chondroitin AC/alginate lyase [Russula earlei]